MQMSDMQSNLIGMIENFQYQVDDASSNEYATYTMQQDNFKTVVQKSYFFALSDQSCVDAITTNFSPEIVHTDYLQCIQNCSKSLDVKSKQLMTKFEGFMNECDLTVNFLILGLNLK